MFVQADYELLLLNKESADLILVSKYQQVPAGDREEIRTNNIF